MKIKKVITVILFVLLTASVAVSVCACNGKNNDAKDRHESAVAVRDTVLMQMNEAWEGELDRSRLLSLESAGDYVVAFGWAELVLDVLEKSSMQTAKLKAMADAFMSADANKLFNDFDANKQLLLPLLKTVGFTQEDISGLAYDLIYAAVDRGEETLRGMYDTLQSLRNDAACSASARDNVEKNRQTVQSALENIRTNITESKKRQILTSFEDAKQALNALISFAYNMSINSISDELNNALFGADGALNDISDSEFITVLNSLLNNVASLKNAIQGDNLNKLDIAINNIISAFDAGTVNSALYASIVTYAKYANMFVSVIPSLCDIIGYAGEIVDETLIGQIRQLATAYDTSADKEGMEATIAVDFMILASRMIVNIMEHYDATSMAEIINGVKASCYTNQLFDVQKITPLFIVDICLNLNLVLNALDGDLQESDLVIAHPDIWGEGTPGFYNMLSLATASQFVGNFENFKLAYYDYCLSDKTVNDFWELYDAAGKCDFYNAFGVTNRYAVTASNYNTPVMGEKTFAQCWYEYYATEGYSQVIRKIIDLSDKATADLIRFTEEYYGGNKELIGGFADKDIILSVLSSEEMQTMFEDVKECGLAIFALIGVLIFS